MIDTPTPAQEMLYGPKRRRVPAIWDVDLPLVSGSVQNQDAYMQATAGQRPYFFDHIEADRQCMDEYAELTGRRYQRVSGFKTEDADYVILGMGSMMRAGRGRGRLPARNAQAQGRRGQPDHVPSLPRRPAGQVLRGKKGVAVLERTDQPLAEDLPLMREVRATVMKCVENGMAAAQGQKEAPYPGYAVYAAATCRACIPAAMAWAAATCNPKA
jgi:pyruvate-ferredoxin/flavodoxin oxidoreductase